MKFTNNGLEYTMFRRILPSILLVAAAAACTDGSEPTALSSPPQGISAADASIQELARGVASAMADPTVRADVRDAMRASLLVQHRLVFRDYVASPQAQRFVGALAKALGTDAAGVRTLATRLPDVDFFVPAREDRRTWEATASFAVAGLVQMPEDGTMPAFAPHGERVEVAFGRVQPGTAILQISPAEFRDRRVNPQPATPGAVIEDAGDGTYGGRFTWTPVNGKPITIDLADMDGHTRLRPSATLTNPDSEEDIGSGGGYYTAPAPADTTYLDYFYIHYADGCGDPDPSFKARYYNASGALVSSGQLDYSGIPRHDPIYPHTPLLFNRIREGSGEKISVNLVDRDSWFCGGDDDMGTREFFASDRGQTRTIFEGSSTPRANITLGWTPKY